MKYLQILFLSYASLSFGQNVVVTSVDAGGASVNSGNLRLVHTIGETHVQEFSDSFQVSEGFILPNFKLKLFPIVFLQGALFNSMTPNLMNDELRANNYLPTTSPYADNATVDTAVFTTTGNNAIVDWVWVELRAENDATKIVTSKSALLQRDGDVVGLDGNATLILNAKPGNYHVVIKHRNHLSVMSANPIALFRDVITTTNFTDISFSTFGSNAQKQLTNSTMALWAGNVNGDHFIQYSGTNPDTPSILSAVLNDPGNFLNFPTYIIDGYTNYDVNMDGKTQYTGTEPDSPYILQNVLAHPGNFLNFSTYQIQEQLPEH